MTRLLLKLSLLVTLMITLTSLIIRILGSTQPINPTLRGFTEDCEDKPQPCWYGIEPGVTTLEAAIVELKQLGYKYDTSPREFASPELIYKSHLFPCTEIRLFPSAFEPKQLDSIFFQECKSIYLGDFIKMFGTPYIWNFYYFNFLNSKVFAILDYIFDAQDNNCLSFMPTSEVLSFGISHRRQWGTEDVEGSEWHGFLPYEQYIARFQFADCETIDRFVNVLRH